MGIFGRKKGFLKSFCGKYFSPAFSPDGSLIAFVCGEVTFSGEENLEIYLMDKNRRMITRNPGTDRYVSWSPDGKFIIYTSSRTNSTAERLMVMDIEKMKASKLDFDRAPLDSEIYAEPKSVGLFCLLPESIIRKTYPDTYFGTERYPNWKF